MHINKRDHIPALPTPPYNQHQSYRGVTIRCLIINTRRASRKHMNKGILDCSLKVGLSMGGVYVSLGEKHSRVLQNVCCDHHHTKPQHCAMVMPYGYASFFDTASNTSLCHCQVLGSTEIALMSAHFRSLHRFPHHCEGACTVPVH